MDNDDDCLDYHKFIEKMSIIELGILNYKKNIITSDRETFLNLSKLLDELISETSNRIF
jgi:hypothetical protein